MTRIRGAVSALALMVLILFSGLAPKDAGAAFIPSVDPAVSRGEAGILDVIRTDLEDQHLAEQLTALGFSPEEAARKIASLSPAERTTVLERVQSIQAGGAITVDTTTLVIIILLLVLLL